MSGKHLSNRDKRFLTICKENAAKNTTNPKWRFYAILATGRRILSRGENKTYKTNPNAFNHAQKLNGYDSDCFIVNSVHAELDCILNSKREDLSNTTLYIARDNDLASRPCWLCLAYIKKAGIKRIVYNTGCGSAVEYLD